MNTNQGDQIRVDSCVFVVRNLNQSSGFSLVIALLMVALMAVITVGVMTTVSLERGTATSYSGRYQADLAVQNGLQAAAKTLAATPTGTSSITGKDTFLVVRVDGTQSNSTGTKDAYYYLAKPQGGTTNQIDYYPLFAGGAPATGLSINLSPTPAPVVQTPVPPAAPFPSPAQDTAGNPYPKLYPFQQPAYTQWQELHDPNDPAIAAPYNLPYQRYTYWAEDLDGYLDASVVGNNYTAADTDPNKQATYQRANGTPSEVALFTIFNPNLVTNDSSTAATTLINNRPLLFTVPTVQQIANTSPDVAGPNLAVRLGVDNQWGNNPGGEQNLVPLGYGYGTGTDANGNPIGEGYSKTPINPVSQLGLNGNQVGKLGNLSAVMPGFGNRPGAGGQAYLNNVSANLFNYAFPLDAPTEFMPGGDPSKPNAYRGIGAYPFVVSVYDLNNWVQTIQVGSSWQVVIETKTYVQIWNAHNYPPPNPLDPSAGLSGALTVHYQDSDKVNVNGTNQTLSSPPDATIIFTANPDPNNKIPAIVSPLFETGNVGQPFNYQIKAGSGYQDPKGRIKPNEYRVVALPGPTPACLVQGRINYNASGLPPGLSLHGGGRFAGLINGTPTSDPPYTNGSRDYSVTITARTNCGNASATLTIRIFQ